jgi:hypothetical protein
MPTHTLPSNGHSVVVYSLLRDVFSALLHNNGYPSIVGCALVGTCLPIRFLETDQSVTICSSQDLPLDGWMVLRIDVLMHAWIDGWTDGFCACRIKFFA